MSHHSVLCWRSSCAREGFSTLSWFPMPSTNLWLVYGSQRLDLYNFEACQRPELLQVLNIVSEYQREVVPEVLLVAE